MKINEDNRIGKERRIYKERLKNIKLNIINNYYLFILGSGI